MGRLIRCQFFIGFHTISGNSDHFSRLNIPDKFCANRSQCTAFRSKYIRVITFSKTQWFQSQRISHTYQLTWTHNYKCISTLQLLRCFKNRFLHRSGMYPFSRYMKGDYF